MPESRFSPQIRVPFSILGEHLDFINEHKLNIEVYFDANSLDNGEVVAGNPRIIGDMLRTLEAQHKD